MPSSPHTLYAMPCSLYSARARAYLRQHGLSYVERSSGEPHFINEIVSKIGRWIIPVLETADGVIIQDGLDIIDHFEAANGAPGTPHTPRHRAIARLFELFGGEGLLRPAMHYRWNFDDQNIDFLRNEFTFGIPDIDDATRSAFFDHSSGRMRQAGAMFGVSETSIAQIEASYAEFLSLFDAHLQSYPFLLGDKSSLGDYSLMGPLYAHLGRDPAPAGLMQRTAPYVFRWTERMNASVPNFCGYRDMSDSFLPGDAVPDTLKALLRYIAEEYLPEFTAHMDFTNNWLDDHPDIEAGANGLEDPAQRGIGMASFSWRGLELRTAVMPYRVYVLQRLQDDVDAMPGEDRALVEALFAETGLSPFLELRVSRRVERKGHLEVWGPPR